MGHGLVNSLVNDKIKTIIYVTQFQVIHLLFHILIQPIFIGILLG